MGEQIIYKNSGGQLIYVKAWDTVNDTPKTGDASNITAEIAKDGGTSAATNDTNPTELDATDHPGEYVFTLSQAESNCNSAKLTPASSTSYIHVEPVTIRTLPGDSSGIYADVRDVSGNDALAAIEGEVEDGLADYGAATSSQLSNAIASGTVANTITGSRSITTDTTWTATINGIGDMTSRTALYVMIKSASTATDDQAIIAWTEGTGLTRLSGQATTSTYGTITVDDATDGDITLTLTEDATGGLDSDVSADPYDIAVKCIKAAEIWEATGLNTITIQDGHIDAVS